MTNRSASQKFCVYERHAVIVTFEMLVIIRIFLEYPVGREIMDKSDYSRAKLFVKYNTLYNQ